MNEEKFWEIWDIVAPNFSIQKLGDLRTKEGVCPVCAVANHVLNINSYKLKLYEASEQIDLPKGFATKVMRAADFLCNDDEILQIRKRLEKSIGKGGAT